MPVGEVLSVAMAADSLTVEARAIVAADYRSLVRDNTLFWIDSGVNFHVGLGGFDLEMGSLETLAMGGVSFATPVPPGVPVHTGHRFLLASAEVNDWRDWQPNLIVGSSSLPDGAAPPTLVRAELVIASRRLGFSREIREAGWLLPLDDGLVLGPPGLLLPTQRQESTGPRLAFAGQEWQLAEQLTQHWGQLATLQLAGTGWRADHAWPRQRMRAPDRPEDCLLFSDPGKNPISLSQRRLVATESIWEIDPAVSINEDWRGGAVVSRADACVVGLIDFHEGQAMVLPVPKEIAPGRLTAGASRTVTGLSPNALDSWPPAKFRDFVRGSTSRREPDDSSSVGAARFRKFDSGSASARRTDRMSRGSMRAASASERHSGSCRSNRQQLGQYTGRQSGRDISVPGDTAQSDGAGLDATDDVSA